MLYSWKCAFLHHYTSYFCYAWNDSIIYFGRELQRSFSPLVHSTQFGSIHKLAKNDLYPITQFEHYCSQYWSPSNTTRYWLPGRICITDHNSSSPVVQPIFHLSYWPLIQLISHQYSDNKSTGDFAKCLMKVEAYNIHCPPLVYSARNLIIGWSTYD